MQPRFLLKKRTLKWITPRAYCAHDSAVDGGIDNLRSHHKSVRWWGCVKKLIFPQKMWKWCNKKTKHDATTEISRFATGTRYVVADLFDFWMCNSDDSITMKSFQKTSHTCADDSNLEWKILIWNVYPLQALWIYRLILKLDDSLGKLKTNVFQCPNIRAL